MSVTILIVDDEDIVRKAICVMFHESGPGDIVLLEANDAAEALNIAREHHGPIDVLLSDVVMPGMNGTEMAAKFGQTHPETKVLLMSGNAPDDLMIKPEWNFIQKPFAGSEIRKRIGNILPNKYFAAY
jgi:two-component system cell cycle sensor histidine kinase/response regulator CckA